MNIRNIKRLLGSIGFALLSLQSQALYEDAINADSVLVDPNWVLSIATDKIPQNFTFGNEVRTQDSYSDAPRNLGLRAYHVTQPFTIEPIPRENAEYGLFQNEHVILTSGTKGKLKAFGPRSVQLAFKLDSSSQQYYIGLLDVDFKNNPLTAQKQSAFDQLKQKWGNPLDRNKEVLIGSSFLYANPDGTIKSLLGIKTKRNEFFSHIRSDKPIINIPVVFDVPLNNWLNKLFLGTALGTTMPPVQAQPAVTIVSKAPQTTPAPKPAPLPNTITSAKDRAIGAFIGNVLGDVLGHPLEQAGHFNNGYDSRGSDDASDWNDKIENEKNWTDDGGQALCLSDMLLETREYKADIIMGKYLQWYYFGYNSCKDIGNGTGSGTRNRFRTFLDANLKISLPNTKLETVQPNTDIKPESTTFGNDQIAAKAYLQFIASPQNQPPINMVEAGVAGTGNYSNGSIMRLSPIPIFYHKHIGSEKFEWASRASSISTNGHPIAVDAAGALSHIIAYCINSKLDAIPLKNKLFDEELENYANRIMNNQYYLLPFTNSGNLNTKFKPGFPPQIGYSKEIVNLLGKGIQAPQEGGLWRHQPGAPNDKKPEQDYYWRRFDSATNKWIYAPRGGKTLQEVENNPDPTKRGIPPSHVKALDSLVASLWAVKVGADYAETQKLNPTETFRHIMRLAVNLGGDADSVGAVTGQIAGAIYGASAIPNEWRNYLETLNGITKRKTEGRTFFDMNQKKMIPYEGTLWNTGALLYDHALN